jgi:hypothetical protein
MTYFAGNVNRQTHERKTKMASVIVRTNPHIVAIPFSTLVKAREAYDEAVRTQLVNGNFTIYDEMGGLHHFKASHLQSCTVASDDIPDWLIAAHIENRLREQIIQAEMQKRMTALTSKLTIA